MAPSFGWGFPTKADRQLSILYVTVSSPDTYIVGVEIHFTTIDGEDSNQRDGKKPAKKPVEVPPGMEWVEPE